MSFALLISPGTLSIQVTNQIKVQTHKTTRYNNFYTLYKEGKKIQKFQLIDELAIQDIKSNITNITKFLHGIKIQR